MSSDTLSTGPIRFAYPGHDEILNLPGLELKTGKVTVIAGENGSGKTTLLKILAGLIEPGAVPSPELQLLRADAAYLHQTPYLFRGTVERNLALAAPQASGNEIGAALATVGLVGFEHRKAKKLSGGESKRVALARCFLSERSVLLLDEPAAHVDAASIALIEHSCRELASQGRTVMVTSHRGGFGYRVADHIVDLSDGSIRTTAVNILKGSSVKEADGHMHFRSGSAEFRAPLRDGDFRVAVLGGEDVILSLEPLDSSARNSLKGRLTGLEKSAGDSIIAVIDCGVLLRSVITDSSVNDLDLKIGKSVYATFKASSVALY